MGKKCQYLAKKANFWPNLHVYRPNILIFLGVSKSFGTHITLICCFTLPAFHIFRFMVGSLLPQWHHFCHQYRCSSWLGTNPPEVRAVWSKAELSTKTFCLWILEENCENALILTWNSFIKIKVKAPQKGMELKFCTQVMWSNQIRAQRPDSQTVPRNKPWRATQALWTCLHSLHSPGLAFARKSGNTTTCTGYSANTSTLCMGYILHGELKYFDTKI